MPEIIPVAYSSIAFNLEPFPLPLEKGVVLLHPVVVEHIYID